MKLNEKIRQALPPALMYDFLNNAIEYLELVDENGASVTFKDYDDLIILYENIWKKHH